MSFARKFRRNLMQARKRQTQKIVRAIQAKRRKRKVVEALGETGATWPTA